MLVLASPGPTGERDDNPYVRLVCSALTAHADERVEVRAFTRSGLLQHPDIVHIHWPEFLIRWDSLRHTGPDIAKVLSLLALARRRGTSVVWTAHNLQPHHLRRPRLWRWFFRLFLTQVDLVVLLTASSIEPLSQKYPSLRSMPTRVVPHGHYRGEYGQVMTTPSARAELGVADTPTLLAFGQITPYKRTVELCDTFAQRADPSVQLIVAGSPSSDDVRDSLTAIDCPGIALFLQRIAHAEVSSFFAACDVVVLPYSPASALNSGVALLALSLGRPVVMLDGGVGRELQSVVGPDWIVLTSADVNEVLQRAVERAQSPTSGLPDLSSLDWQRIGDLTLSAYRVARNTRRRTA